MCALLPAQAYAAVEAKLRRAHESAVAALDARFAELRDCSRAILAVLGAALR